MIFSNLNSNCSNLLLRYEKSHGTSLKSILLSKNCSDLSLCGQIALVFFKIFTNSQALALNFKSLSRSLEYFFLTVGQNNFGNKIPFLEKPGKEKNSRL